MKHTFNNLENGKTYYAKVYTVNHKGRINNRIDLPYVSAIPSDFPEPPTSYNLIDTYTNSMTFTAPEHGYYQIEVFGSSGAGGDAVGGMWDEDYDEYTSAASGGGGGSGGYALAAIKLNAGDTVQLILGAIAEDTTIDINSTKETYNSISITGGKNGGNGYVSSQSQSNREGGAGGAGGIVSGTNLITYKNGKKGSDGDTSYGDYVAGGSGGYAVITDGNAGGKGADWDYTFSSNRGYGKAAFVKIYRGDTNVVA